MRVHFRDGHSFAQLNHDDNGSTNAILCQFVLATVPLLLKQKPIADESFFLFLIWK